MFEKHPKKLEAVLPDGFLLMANALKAGLGMHQAFQMAAEEGPSPFKETVAAILEKTKLGHSLDEALLDSAHRLNSPDFSLMAHSIVLLRGIGGNLVGHLENLSRILRERQRVSAKIHLLTAQGMAQGAILAVMPFGLAACIAFISPEFISPLFTHPLGWLSVFLILGLDLGGYLWMRKLARIRI